MKKLGLCLLSAAFFAGVAAAQSAEKIADIDETEKVSYGQFCYLIATNSGTLSDGATYQEAFDAIRRTSVFYSNVLPNDPIPMSDVALLCSQTWNIQESLMYRLTKAPRYAFRQLQALDIIPLTASPTSTSSGHQILNVITLCIDFAGEGE